MTEDANQSAPPPPPEGSPSNPEQDPLLKGAELAEEAARQYDEENRPEDAAERREAAQELRDRAARVEGSFAKKVYEARADELDAAGPLGEVATQIPVTEASELGAGVDGDAGWDEDKAKTIGTAAKKLAEDDEPESSWEERQFARHWENPLEELYNLAPKTFAQMPTQEFIAVYKELGRLEDAIPQREKVLAAWMQMEESVSEAIEAEQPIDKSELSLQFARFNDAYLFPDEESQREMYERFRSTFSDKNIYNNSPRQIAEEVRQMITGCITRSKQLLDEAERAKQEFMAKYTKQDEAAIHPEQAETTEANPA